MTREEASFILANIDRRVCDDELNEALDMAIKALEQEPSGDLISKKSAKNAIYKVCLSEGNKDIFVKILDEINKLPSIEQEPSVEIVNTEESNDNGTKYLNINVSDGEVKRNPDVVRLCSDVGMLEYAKPSGDAISRQAVQDYIAKYLSQYLYDDVREAVEVIDEYIGELPSVKQEPKTGHWMKSIDINFYKCSECGCHWEKGMVENCNMDFCPNCGARMESEG